MKNWKKVLAVLSSIVGVVLIADFGATSAGTVAYDRVTMAYWVQAVGSITAILGALWIASDQHRRDVAARAKTDSEFEYVLNAELAWLSTDVLSFLNQFFYIEANGRYAYVISDDEVSDLLERLSWCRQRAKHKGQLAMVGTMRRSLLGTARIIRLHIAKPAMLITFDEVKKLEEFSVDAKNVMNAATGVEKHPQFMP